MSSSSAKDKLTNSGFRGSTESNVCKDAAVTVNVPQTESERDLMEHDSEPSIVTAPDSAIGTVEVPYEIETPSEATGRPQLIRRGPFRIPPPAPIPPPSSTDPVGDFTFINSQRSSRGGRNIGGNASHPRQSRSGRQGGIEPTVPTAEYRQAAASQEATRGQRPTIQQGAWEGAPKASQHSKTQHNTSYPLNEGVPYTIHVSRSQGPTRDSQHGLYSHREYISSSRTKNRYERPQSYSHGPSAAEERFNRLVQGEMSFKEMRLADEKRKQRREKLRVYHPFTERKDVDAQGGETSTCEMPKQHGTEPQGMDMGPQMPRGVPDQIVSPKTLSTEQNAQREDSRVNSLISHNRQPEARNAASEIPEGSNSFPENANINQQTIEEPLISKTSATPLQPTSKEPQSAISLQMAKQRKENTLKKEGSHSMPQGAIEEIPKTSPAISPITASTPTTLQRLNLEQTENQTQVIPPTQQGPGPEYEIIEAATSGHRSTGEASVGRTRSGRRKREKPSKDKYRQNNTAKPDEPKGPTQKKKDGQGKIKHSATENSGTQPPQSNAARGGSHRIPYDDVNSRHRRSHTSSREEDMASARGTANRPSRLLACFCPISSGAKRHVSSEVPPSRHHIAGTSWRRSAHNLTRHHKLNETDRAAKQQRADGKQKETLRTKQLPGETILRPAEANSSSERKKNKVMREKRGPDGHM